MLRPGSKVPDPTADQKKIRKIDYDLTVSGAVNNPSLNIPMMLGALEYYNYLQDSRAMLFDEHGC